MRTGAVTLRARLVRRAGATGGARVAAPWPRCRAWARRRPGARPGEQESQWWLAYLEELLSRTRHHSALLADQDGGPL